MDYLLNDAEHSWPQRNESQENNVQVKACYQDCCTKSDVADAGDIWRYTEADSDNKDREQYENVDPQSPVDSPTNNGAASNGPLGDYLAFDALFDTAFCKPEFFDRLFDIVSTACDELERGEYQQPDSGRCDGDKDYI